MFESAKLKIGRADLHINDLENRLAELLQDNSYDLRPEHDPETGQYSIRGSFKRNIVGDQLALMVGDAVHNMRTALDHLTWELIGRDRGNQDVRLQFPVGATAKEFEAACKRIETPSQSVIDALRSCEAFPSGKGSLLYTVSRLDNIDKHRTFVPVVRILQIPDHVVLNPDGSAYSYQSGSLWASNDTGSFRVELANIPDGTTIQIDEDTLREIRIVFGEVDDVQNEPIVETLRRLSRVVSDAVHNIQRSIP